MAKSKFNVGDRVVCLYNIKNNYGKEFESANKLGTIKVKDRKFYGVEFDENVEGNSLVLDSICYSKSQHGLWMPEHCLVEAYEDDEPKKEYEISEELKEKLYKEFYARVIIDLKVKKIIPDESFFDIVKEEELDESLFDLFGL